MHELKEAHEDVDNVLCSCIHCLAATQLMMLQLSDPIQLPQDNQKPLRV